MSNKRYFFCTPHHDRIKLNASVSALLAEQYNEALAFSVIGCLYIIGFLRCLQSNCQAAAIRKMKSILSRDCDCLVLEV